MKKLLLLVMLVSFANAASAANVWTRPTVDGPGNWNDVANWEVVAGIPTVDTDVTLTGQNANNLAEIQVTDAQTFGARLRHGNNVDGAVLVIMNGGTLSSGNDATRSYVGDSFDAEMTVDAGGVFTTLHRLYIGHEAGVTGILNVAGTVNVDNQKTLVGDTGDGFLNIYPGGVYNAKGFASGSFTIGDNSIVNLIGNGALVTDGDDLDDANILIAGGRFAAWGVLGAGVTAAYDADLDLTAITVTDANDPLERTPAYNAVVSTVDSSDVDLSWVNLEPNALDGDVWIDVWFGTDPTFIPEPNELQPNYPGYYVDFNKVVDAETVDGLNAISTTVSAPGNNQRYLWRIDTYRYGNPDVVSYGDDGDPNTADYLVDEGLLMPFTVFNDAPPTIVIDSPSMITWVGGDPIPLTATVTDDGVTEVIIEWDSGNETEPNIIFTDETWDPVTKIATANVIVDYPTNNFNVRVRATDDAGTYLFANLVLQCRADACDAARWLMDQNALPAADVNDDCEFDLLDIAVLATDWVYDYALKVPTPMAP